MYNSLEHNRGVGTGLESVTPAEMSGAEETFTLSEILQLLRRRRWVILAVMIVVVGGALGFGLTRTPTYEASTSLFVGQQQDAGDPFNLAGDVEGLQMLTQTLATAVNSRPIAQAVIQELNLPLSPNDLTANLQAQQVPNTQFVQVTYKDTNPERAQRVANAITKVFSARISEISPKASGVTVSVWEPATVPVNPVSPNFLLILPLALALGTVLGVTLALLLEYWESGWRSAEEVERAIGRPVVAVISAFDVSKGRGGRS